MGELARQSGRVPFGYEPPSGEGAPKGTLIVYDSFQLWEEADLQLVLNVAERKRFAKVVWYPLHEETVRRMGSGPVRPFYERFEGLHAFADDHSGAVPQTVEGWEGKRKKYTPIEAALRFMQDKYSAPFFVYMTEQTANRFASYASFDEWIRDIRLILAPEAEPSLHAKLQKMSSRWERAVPGPN